jgi:hypothetical protein
MSRCHECVEQDRSWCEHRHTLLVYIDGASVMVGGANEQSARATADRLRIRWRGAPFHRPRSEQVSQ